MTLDDDSETLRLALQRLYARRRFGVKLGLAPVRRMCEVLGHPEQSYGVIHVAGTNGKGSVAAMIASMLAASGLRVGLYTSPHLVRFNERIQVDGAPLTDVALCAALDACEQAAETVRAGQGHEATFFEIATVLAFECFRRSGVKLAVLETGLGGRLDATNVVTPLCSVITRIAMDHARYLGDTLALIAGEKAGIIKPGRPVISAPQDATVCEVLRAAAADAGARFMEAEAVVEVQRMDGDLQGQKVHYETTGGLTGTARYPLPGDHQLENLGVALATVETFFELVGAPLEAATVKAGLEGLRWHGRCECLCKTPRVITDAAHNPAGARALAATLRRCGIRNAGLVLGVCGDKDVTDIVRALAPIVRRVWVVPVPHARGMSTERLCGCVRAAGLDATGMELDAALDAAEAWALETDETIVITGSLFLVGAVLPRFLPFTAQASEANIEL